MRLYSFISNYLQSSGWELTRGLSRKLRKAHWFFCNSTAIGISSPASTLIFLSQDL